MVCPQIVSTDLDDLWLLCILGEAESTGTSERDMENSFLRNDAVFPPALCKHGQDRLCWLSHGGQSSTIWACVSRGEYPQSCWSSNVVYKTAFPSVFDLTNRVKTSFTSVENSADSREPLLRWSLATGHATDILDEYDPDVGYDPETFP
jgi:hypothetical protein